MGAKHSRIYAEVKHQAATEDYPLVKSIAQLRFLEFEVFKLLKKFPEANTFSVPFDKIRREESIIIFISHVWLTELSSIPGRADFSHPDNREHEKYDLCVDAVQKILENMVSDRVKTAYLWIDFSCATREIKNSSDVILDKVLEVSDLMLTPLVDPQHATWQLSAGVVDHFVDYKATSWNGNPKSYLNRGWNRVEMFYSLDTPLTENPDGTFRFDLFRGECRYYRKKGIRPHLIFGTKEAKANQIPIVLAPLQVTQYAELNPLLGFFPVEKDKLIVQELVEHLKIDRRVVVEDYRGHIEGDKKFGFGVMTYANGNQYKGEFEDNMRDGRGRMMFANGDVFDGDWREDMICGQGVMRYANGSIYIGRWTNNARHGQGTYQMKDWVLEAGVLSEYNGMWYADKQNGWGITVYSNGDEHEGEYKDGKRNGPGVLRDCDRNVLFDGMFVNDDICGYGMMNYDNGDVYSGHFKDSKRHGKGRLFFKNGDSYEGDFFNNNIEGEGVMNSEGESYVGSFANGMKNGHGEIAFANGDVFTGNFVNNQPCGHGVMKYANGRRVPLINGRKKRFLTSCLMMSAAAMVIVAADVFTY